MKGSPRFARRLIRIQFWGKNELAVSRFGEENFLIIGTNKFIESLVHFLYKSIINFKENNMACLLVPATAAIITTSVSKKIAPKYHIEWLNTMFWGGVVMLAVEHVSHGEIVPFPPFLTAMQNSADIPVMLHEMATIGVAMTVAIVFVWSVMVLVANKAANTRKNKIQLVTS